MAHNKILSIRFMDLTLRNNCWRLSPVITLSCFTLAIALALSILIYIAPLALRRKLSSGAFNFRFQLATVDIVRNTTAKFIFRSMASGHGESHPLPNCVVTVKYSFRIKSPRKSYVLVKLYAEKTTLLNYILISDAANDRLV